MVQWTSYLSKAETENFNDYNVVRVIVYMIFVKILRKYNSFPFY